MRLWPIILLILCGCAMTTRREAKRADESDANSAALAEESRALTTGALDALSHAPTNKPTALAKRFLQRDQQIEGTPARRIDVAAILAENVEAVRDLNRRLDAQDALLVERAELQRKLQAAQADLMELGRKYDAERSRSIWRRVLGWATATFGIGGLIAMVVMCPAVLPILGGAASWIIARVPALVNLFGFVGKKAFDGVVAGVGRAREKLKIEEGLPADRQPTYTPAQVRQMIDDSLKQALEVGDANFKPLVSARRKALNV